MNAGKLRKSGWSCVILIAGVVTWMLFLATAPLQAQSTGWGTIIGRVTDQSGAVVPNAEVKLRNEATNVTATAVSNAAGDYAFTNVIPGTYQVSFIAKGFKPYDIDHLVMYVSQTVRQDAPLTLGAVSQTVEVTSTLPLVQTTTSEVGSVVDSKQITMMPLNGRTNLWGMLALAPGVQLSGSNARVGGATWRDGTSETMDGIEFMEQENERLADLSPSLDAIAEFKVVDSSGSAENGVGTVQIITASKSGTDKFHGTAFEYNRIRALSAANFFSTAIPKGQFIRNEFGGSLGGPIKRDKLFFFGSYESWMYHSNSTAVSAQPTTALLQGNFTGLATITDPTTGQPFPNNQIPTGRISSISSQFFKYFLTPNTQTTAAGGLGNNFTGVIPISQNRKRPSARVDYNINAKNAVSVRYFYVDQAPYTTAGSTPLMGGTIRPNTSHSLAVNYTSTITPSIANVATFGYSREWDNIQPQNHSFDPCTVITALPCSLPNLGGLPTMAITGFTGLSDNQGSGDTIPTWEGHDTLTWIKGSHLIKGGFSYMRWQYYNFQNPAPAHGTFSFTGHYTGNAFADYLLGYLATDGYPIAPLEAKPTNDRFGFWIQDSWKATQRLTVNVGLRYDYSTQAENVGGNMSNWYPNLNEVATLQGNLSNLPYWSAYPIVSGSSLGLNAGNYIGNDANTWAPRVGLAYMPTGSKGFVVRAGYGMYYDMLPWVFSGAGYAPNNPPFASSFTFEPQPGATPTLTFANPFPTGAGAVPTGASVNGLARNWKFPLSHEWNLSVEKQISGSTALRASYLGNECEHCPQPLNINDPVPLAAAVQPRRYYQPWGAITYWQSGETSNVQELQLSAIRRFSSGMSFEVEYAWTKWLYGSLYDITAPIDNLNYRLDRGNSTLMAPQYLIANYIYEVPIGNGKRFLSSLRGPLNVLFGGWQTTGIVTLAGGTPYSVTWTSSTQGWPSSRAQIVGNPKLTSPSIHEWFNPAAYAVPPSLQFGDSAPGSLSGPHYFNWDAGLYKGFRLGERVNLQFRLEAFDWLNHPSFSVPASNISATSTVGTITSTANAARNIQFALRLEF